MINFMMELEATLLQLSKMVSTVVEDLRSKVKWIAEAEISVMTKGFRSSENRGQQERPGARDRAWQAMRSCHRDQVGDVVALTRVEE